MNENVIENRAGKVVGLLFVLAIHLGLLYLAMSYKLIPPPQEALVMMVDLINPPKKEEPPPPPEPPKPEPPKEVKLVKEKTIKPKPEPKPILAVEAPAETPTEFVVEKQPEPEPIKEEPTPAPTASQAVAEAPAKTSAPVHMSELSVGCSHRPEPNYPPASRRMGEQGTVKLRVELDETGNIGAVKVIESSGHPRLDNAGVSIIKSWKCEAATRDGQPARAIATQIFDFKLE